EVDVEARPEELLGHRRAFDVPAGTAAAPRRLPPRVLPLFVRLPEREVARISLERIRFLLFHLVGALARQAAVLRKALDAEIDVALCLVRVTVPNQLLDQRDDLGDRLRRPRLGFRTAEPARHRALD